MEKSPEHPGAPNLQLEVDRFGEVGAEEPVGTTHSYSNPGFNTLSWFSPRVPEKEIWHVVL